MLLPLPQPPHPPLATLGIADYVVIAAYFTLVIYLGHRSSRKVKGQESFFLAGRKLGRIYQFFLNLGNSTDANGAVSTASLVYQQGVSGVWLSFQLIFLNPYYWFMNMWFRRVRLMTTAELFEDRLGSRRLPTFYALFQVFAAVIVVIGFGNLATYKITSALIVKPQIEWTAEERTSVEGHRGLRELEARQAAAPLNEEERQQLQLLRARDARGELHSYITSVDPLTFYIVYTLIVGLYIVMGGMAATATNEIVQSLLIITLSAVLIPTGLAAIGGWHVLGERLPAAVFELVSSQSAGQVTGLVLIAILLAALVQINGIMGNMSISGSAQDEFAARFGAVSGTFVKRLLIIMWAFCGLIALVLFQGPTALSDPDAAWGAMSVQLLGPGLLGVMVTGVLAANMSTVAAQTMAVSALVVRNLYAPFRPRMSEGEALMIGRVAIVVVLLIGIVAALSMNDIFTAVQLLQTINVPFGATVMLIFFWRRLTAPAVWTAVLLCAIFNIVGPLVVSRVEAVRTHPALLARSQDATGKMHPVFFDSVVHTDPENLESSLVGRGRFHFELFALDRLGLDVASLSPSTRFAARFLFDAISPFVLLIVVSLLTRPTDRARLDQFYGKMKTPIGSTPELETAVMEETRRNPQRFEHTKLFPHSNWEFTKWDRIDTIGFFVCAAISATIIGLFWLLLRWAAP